MSALTGQQTPEGTSCPATEPTFSPFLKHNPGLLVVLKVLVDRLAQVDGDVERVAHKVKHDLVNTTSPVSYLWIRKPYDVRSILSARIRSAILPGLPPGGAHRRMMRGIFGALSPGMNRVVLLFFLC